MSNENKEQLVTKVNSEAPTVTFEQLAKLFLDSQKNLAEAIKESRIPYQSPAQIRDKENAIAERRKMIAIELNTRTSKRNGCPHVRENDTPNIKWMQHSNGITKGVCGTCGYDGFDTRNPEDAARLRRDLKSIKNMGRAGEHARKNYAGGAVIPAI